MIKMLTNIRTYILIIFMIIATAMCYGNNIDDFNPFKKNKYSIPKYSKSVMLERLEDIGPAIQPKMNGTVKRCINEYVVGARTSAERILGRSFLYFPIMDHYLKQYDLPLDLKALSIVESHLNPKAISPMGAAGLWQFIPSTARMYGLKIDSYVDERLDPHKATEAAVRYLSDLYDMYGDWALVAAAYNCGPGRLNQAIRKGRSKDYWKIRRYLPKETQMYVPKIIGATYMMTYYIFHDLHPVFPDYDLQHTNEMVIYKYMTFKQIKEHTGVSLKVIKALNPAYKRGIIPPNETGSFIILPRMGLVSSPEILKD